MHGTINGYSQYVCRCGPCKDVWRKRQAELQQELANRPTPDRVHGSLNGYNNYGCRCDRCREAKRQANPLTMNWPEYERQNSRAREEYRYHNEQIRVREYQKLERQIKKNARNTTP